MQNLDLRPELLAIVRQILATHLPDAEVLAYGSRVTGTAHDGSDLDLAARNPHNPQLPVQNLAEVRDAFSESNLPILVDILDWSQVPDSFRQEIERVGVVAFPFSSG
ncbi:MAG TPA: nucleotidyltransferase domain-containing protein [Desulfuromonadales bacterium]|nr:nucleotidyltransferase domain-containing protein [Desulfuromonadales bacterium]